MFSSGERRGSQGQYRSTQPLDPDVTEPSMGTSDAITRKPRSRSGFVDVGKVLASSRQMRTIRLIMASSDG